MLNGDRTLLARTPQSAKYLVAVIWLTAAVLFDDHVGDLVNPFVRSKASCAVQALAATPDRFALFTFARVYNLIFEMTAKWTQHKLVFARQRTVIASLFEIGAVGFDLFDGMLARHKASKPLNTYITVEIII